MTEKNSQLEYQGNRKPILVTGAHRTGTTWIGKMLAASGQATYISEPLNIWHRPGVMRTPTRHWYTYICPQNEADYLPALRDTLQLRYHTWAEIKSLRSLKDLLRMGRDWTTFLSGRIHKERALIKDPFAVFSVPWFAQVLDCQVVITVRHPAAFVSGLKRLNWLFDFKHLLAQPLLMQDWLEPFRREMESMNRSVKHDKEHDSGNPGDMISSSSLLWRMIYLVAREFQPRFRLNLYSPQNDWTAATSSGSLFSQILVVRHEDLSLDPIQGYQALYADLGLQFTPKVQQVVTRSSSTENPKEISKRRKYAVRLDSRANLDNWKHRLSREEITRIRYLTEDVAELYYPDLSWE